MQPATVLLCMEDQHCDVQLKFCPSLAVPALLLLPATGCWPQYCASQSPGRCAFMLTGLLYPWTILFAQRYNISTIFIHKKCFTVCRNFYSTRVARMGLLLFCQGIKFHCLSYLLCGQTWNSCFWLSDAFPHIKNVVSSICQHICMNTPHLIVLNVWFQVMKYLHAY